MGLKREVWIDRVKLFACILVLIGHFFQSMVRSDVLNANGLYHWGNQTIYFFHVPLFFLCSGYLYQKSCGPAFLDWKNNLIKKLVTLGIPYFTFSIITWILKEAFSGSVNSANGDLITSLFFVPASPYWYLYVLFFLFLLTSTMRSKAMAQICLVFALALKFTGMIFKDGINVYLIKRLLENGIWFVLGMVACVYELPQICKGKKWLHIGIAMSVVFLLASITICIYDGNNEVVSFLMGVLGCAATVLIFFNVDVELRAYDAMTRYTMPVFLMHTIFAAGIRAVIDKLGVGYPLVHVVAGLVSSFVGPIIAIEIMKKVKLDILIYPGKYIKFQKPLLKE